MQHRPKRSLGQNFLRDASVSQRVVEALDLEPGELVIEIGPGHGALTDRLVESGARVTAIEFDRELAPMLDRRFAGISNFSVIEADALHVDFASLISQCTLATPGSMKLVANLPYNISTPILQRLIDQRDVFSRLVLMFQREVVERITATPRGKARGFLSVIAQNAFEIEYLFDVPPQAFDPVPKVWSSVIRLKPTHRTDGEQKLREVVSRAFAQKRKTLVNNLSRIYPEIAAILSELTLPDKVRAEELTLVQWRELSRRLARS
jgi:16S rRNA (adenine1518-N6/adenine1519-N6)-dimethyltransferase